jgi:uncharacterized protein
MNMNQRSLSEKRDSLRRFLAECIEGNELLLVAYSGGVDSAYLAWEASQVLGDGMLAVIADSPSLPRKELALAIDFAACHFIPLQVVATSELQSESYARNDPSRCFYCKDELFRVMNAFSQQLGATKIAYGRNSTQCCLPWSRQALAKKMYEIWRNRQASHFGTSQHRHVSLPVSSMAAQ